MPPLDRIDPRVLGRRIAEARQAKGKTQDEVAEFLASSRSTYLAVESGERPATSDQIVKLAGFFGQTVHDLVRPSEPIADLGPHLSAAPRAIPDPSSLMANRACRRREASQC
jgi:transcriptional regulator with XRE-family HTH domain